ncbi:XkdX family protein [Lacticaseibacillus salsurivasis]
MYKWGCPIEGYVESGAITSDEYKQITGSEVK